MKKAFKASRLIGLLALAFGLMAFSATAAQAEVNAFWKVNGSTLSGNETVQAENDSAESVLLTEIGSSKIEILCVPIKFVGATISGTGASGKIHYEKCVTIDEKGVQQPRCVPKSSGAATTGLIETNALKGLLKLHELAGGAKDDLLELAPASGTAFVTIELGALCAFGNKFDITGKAFLEDCQHEGLIDKVKHLFQEGPLTELFFGAKPAKIDGSAWGFLSGVHATQTFSGHPA